METATLYAYEISPGNDDLLYFTESLEECQAAALEQRRDFSENDPTKARCYGDLSAPDRQMLLRVLNDETSLAEACVVERKLVALVTD
ncbi:hypothetical protein GOL24_31730 [Sinorhizobium medicae]|uniref:hypothetical protein n=1 Tax=Sinorhizobium medicae TaxID=110321 RepID=UPI000C7C021A|nr:hypothetical protein [Sinorhizobium medicae]MDX1128716.1 hypothetical protein [Sinorhizobium medicae]MDX1232103.1 hypothetical protein [Sinorhizobium medicae]PLU21089.1 hypothetical protein BMJ31_17480 [Sinorhizobium medicae]PLU30760.1 hypothetical protein BMJ28_23720 [Sinorhizobium medicae]PLU58040.1 hypothetical protein BMJ24_17120 [Sinorhizobium medicae]